MDQKDQEKITQRIVKRIADDFHCTVDEVNRTLDAHPIEVDRDKFLKRALGLQLLRLDELEEIFHSKAITDADVAAGALVVKIHERRATLLGLNPVTGHAVSIVQHPPTH